ncbi:hypothetical protein [Microbacterium aurugineum]|uniref:Uncharacterized protein n=1 Tax=Microbacterium aurugineum TaxID=2851642 RepID=A0ABY4IXL9_9MICO|nr:hypothetical protein [Microbacterium aurugineum]UPL17334.1 hypothetical protein KV397_05985 [Microbacterium aurugineum]
MEYLFAGGPFDGQTVPLPKMTGYELDPSAVVPTLRWLDGPVYTLKGGPFEGEQLPFLPAGYEEDPDDSAAGIWTMKELSYNFPYPADKISKLGERYCSACGIRSRWRPMSELTLIIHPVTGTNGHFRFYCPTHVPDIEWNAAREDRRQPCPSCSTLMPMSGACDFCG